MPPPRRRRAPLPLVAAAVLATLIAAAPLLYLVVRAGEGGWGPVRDTLWRQRTLELALRSLALSAMVTALCLVIGVALAWLVTRTDVPFRRVVQVVAGLPLALPSYVAAWAWIGTFPSLHGGLGAVVVLTSVSYPFVYLPVMAALRRCDPAIEDVALTLGHNPLTVFVRCTLPQIRPAAIGGGLLVGLYVLSDFGAVSIMRHEVLTHVIYRSYRASFDRTPAAVLGCVLAVLALLLVVAERRVRRGSIARLIGGTPRRQRIVALGPWRWPSFAAVALVAAFALGVPLWGMARWYQRGSSRASWSQLIEAAGGSLLVGALAAVCVVALAVPIGILSARHRSRSAAVATATAYAGHALPGVVVGLAVVFFGIRFAQPFYQELPMLILAYVVLFLSLAVGSIHSAVAQIPATLDDAARTLGFSAWEVWTKVILRRAAPGIGAAATLVFLTVMKELPATLFLRPTGFDTMATRLWGHVSSSSYAAAAPYAVAIVVLAAVPTALLSVIGDKESRS